jgi:LTN1 family HEAT repeat region
MPLAHLGISQMCHLLTDASVDNQKMAYQMLQRAAVTRTEHLVVEAGVDSENIITTDLPRELVALLQSSVNLDDTEASGQDPLPYLLGWMIVFDLFTDTVSVSPLCSYEVIKHLCAVTEGQDRIYRSPAHIRSYWRLLSPQYIRDTRYRWQWKFI